MQAIGTPKDEKSCITSIHISSLAGGLGIEKVHVLDDLNRLGIRRNMILFSLYDRSITIAS